MGLYYNSPTVNEQENIMKQPSTDKPRLVEATEVAEDMFWNAIATAYPEVKSGDFPPDLAMEMSDKLTQFVTVWLKMNEPTPRLPKVTEIMLHRIEYNYDNELALTDVDEEHIAYSISQGISEGELNTSIDGKATRGYWKINNCPNA